MFLTVLFLILNRSSLCTLQCNIFKCLHANQRSSDVCSSTNTLPYVSPNVLRYGVDQRDKRAHTHIHVPLSTYSPFLFFWHIFRTYAGKIECFISVIRKDVSLLVSFTERARILFSSVMDSRYLTKYLYI